MRRKPTPSPIERAPAGAVRRLAPATRAFSMGVLPTVAALALALAGCSAPEDEGTSSIQADPSSHVSQPIGETAHPSSTSSAGAVDPTPIHMPGVPALVIPVPAPPPVKPKVRPYVGTPVPSSKPPKLGGKPMATHPWSI